MLRVHFFPGMALSHEHEVMYAFYLKESICISIESHVEIG